MMNSTNKHWVLDRAGTLAWSSSPEPAVTALTAPEVRRAATDKALAFDGGNLRPADSTSEWRCGSVDIIEDQIANQSRRRPVDAHVVVGSGRVALRSLRTLPWRTGYLGTPRPRKAAP
jgi:hypothetical protein